MSFPFQLKMERDRDEDPLEGRRAVEVVYKRNGTRPGRVIHGS